MSKIEVGQIRISLCSGFVVFDDIRSRLTAAVPMPGWHGAWQRIRSDPDATWHYHDREGGTLLTAEMTLNLDTHPPTLHCDVRIVEVQASPMHAALDGLVNEKGGG